MTFCVGAKFPFGIWANVTWLPSHPAILFATDSRLTDSSGKTFDVGNKLFQVSTNAGIVFSGNYDIGRKCVRKLQSNVRGSHTEKATNIIAMTESIFKEEFYRLAPAYPNRHLSLMVGIYDNVERQARLVGFVSPAFEPVELNGVEAIGGTQQIKELYKQKFDEFVAWQMSRGSGVSDSPLEWGNFIQIVLDEVANELKVDPHIGGLVQTAIIHERGFQWVNHSILKPHGKWIETHRKDEHWRVTEVDTKKEIARTEEPERFFKVHH